MVEKKYKVLFIAVSLVVLLLAAGCSAPSTTGSSTGTSVPATQQTVVQNTMVASIPTAGSETYSYTDADNGKTVAVPVTNHITITLNENPTTGYMWNATVTPGLTVMKDVYNAPNSNLAGASGTHTWDLVAMQKGSQKFSAVYRRSWETPTAGDTTYVLNINVQ